MRGAGRQALPHWHACASLPAHAGRRSACCSALRGSMLYAHLMCSARKQGLDVTSVPGQSDGGDVSKALADWSRASTIEDIERQALLASRNVKHARVILLLRHDEQGSEGLILNKATGCTIGNFTSKLPLFKDNIIHYGGKVAFLLFALATMPYSPCSVLLHALFSMLRAPCSVLHALCSSSVLFHALFVCVLARCPSFSAAHTAAPRSGRVARACDWQSCDLAACLTSSLLPAQPLLTVLRRVALWRCVGRLLAGVWKRARAAAEAVAHAAHLSGLGGFARDSRWRLPWRRRQRGKQAGGYGQSPRQ